ncbi:MAG: hypothetical protein CMC00_02455 [Flavobacteriaceae bacterium]|nr:hypothetical protein [Flavobacteriaceae bacterium]|tara:strand:+ start:87 stop:473 length:387 start_codon:yes stop_codon:yes gene_type:complete
MSLSKKNKVIITILLVFSVIGFTIYTYAMRPPTAIENKKIDFSGSSDELLLKIIDHTEEWQDKIVVVSGEVTSLDDKGILLSASIYCQLKDTTVLKKINPSNNISLKGRIIGYDDLLEELKLDQCIIQ